MNKLGSLENIQMVLLMVSRLDSLVNIEARPANRMAMLVSTSDSWGNIGVNLASTKKEKKSKWKNPQKTDKKFLNIPVGTSDCIADWLVSIRVRSDCTWVSLVNIWVKSANKSDSWASTSATSDCNLAKLVSNSEMLGCNSATSDCISDCSVSNLDFAGSVRDSLANIAANLDCNLATSGCSLAMLDCS